MYLPLAVRYLILGFPISEIKQRINKFKQLEEDLAKGWRLWKYFLKVLKALNLLNPDYEHFYQAALGASILLKEAMVRNKLPLA